MSNLFWSYENKENIPPPHTPMRVRRRLTDHDDNFMQAEPLATSTPPSTPLANSQDAQTYIVHPDLTEVGRRLENIIPLRSAKRNANTGLRSSQRNDNYIPGLDISKKSLGTKALLGTPKKQPTYAVQRDDDPFDNKNDPWFSIPKISQAKDKGKGKARAKDDGNEQPSGLKSEKHNSEKVRHIRWAVDTTDHTDTDQTHENSFITTRAKFQPSSKLAAHLKLNNGSEEASRTAGWLHKEEELIYNQVCLMPASSTPMALAAAGCYFDVRQDVLNLLESPRYNNYTYAMLFSGFSYFSVRRRGQHGYCLYLLCEYQKSNRLAKDIKKIVSKHRSGRYLDVVVHRGKPKLYGSYGISSDHENQPDETLNTGLLFGSGHSKTAQRSKPLKRDWIQQTIHREDNTPTPDHTPPEIITTTEYTEQPFSLAWPGFHYGLHWITNLPVGCNEDGILTKYSKYPDIGSSIGRTDDNYGCGTLGGYLVNEAGEHFILSAYHVFNHLIDLHKPHPTGTQNGRWVLAPARSDILGQHKALVKKRDALAADLLRAVKHNDSQAYDRVVDEGMQTVKDLEDISVLKNSDELILGQVIGSSWKIVTVDGTRHLVDMTLIRPLHERLGSNTFTYHGRDKPYGAEYRIEARGWATPRVGDSVLKVGRTTGLTKGTIISIAADLKICVGVNEIKALVEGKRSNHYMVIEAHIATAGSSPWFSEAGDSGAFILRAPSVAQMNASQELKGDQAIPTQAPVVGLLFGGADSVEGVHLTFFNSSDLIQSQIRRIAKDAKLTPGLYYEEPESNINMGLRAARRAWGNGQDSNTSGDGDNEDYDTPQDHPFMKKVAFNDMVDIIKRTDKLLKEEEEESIHTPKRKKDRASTQSEYTPTRNHRKTPPPTPRPTPRPKMTSIKYPPQPPSQKIESSPYKMADTKHFTYKRESNVNNIAGPKTPAQEESRGSRTLVPQTASPVLRNPTASSMLDNDHNNNEARRPASTVRRQPRPLVETTPVASEGPRRRLMKNPLTYRNESYEQDDDDDEYNEEY